MSEAKSEEKGGDGEQWGEGKEQGEGKDGVVDDEAEAKGERDDRVEIDQATVSPRARSTTRPASPAAPPPTPASSSHAPNPHILKCEKANQIMDAVDLMSDMVSERPPPPPSPSPEPTTLQCHPAA